LSGRAPALQERLFFLVKINQTDKSSAKLTKNKIEKTQITKIRNERGGITMNFIEMGEFSM
jgi:hypothetical protein